MICLEYPLRRLIAGLLAMLIAASGVAQQSTPQVLYYRHPHNPTITSDKPLKDEMGMDYVPIYDSGGDESAVTISPAVVQNMGVRSVLVEFGDLARRIDTVGYVDFDENKLSHIHLRTDGWIERLYVKSEGERVAKGAALFELYSPTLVNAQEEYLEAIDAGSKTLIRASRERLTALGVSPDQIKQLSTTGKAKQRLLIHAPQDGIVASLNVRDGMYVKPATEVMTLADLSTIWLLAEVFEGQAAWVKTGQAASVRLPYLPGREWSGSVEYIYPSLDPKTRTLKVRLRFDNPAEELKPNMFADVVIESEGKQGAIKVPAEAVIRTGEGERIIVDAGNGRFEPRSITVGIESGGWVEVLTGVRPGERVVISGQFLIDSEASLKASFTRMRDDSDSQSHQHGSGQ